MTEQRTDTATETATEERESSHLSTADLAGQGEPQPDAADAGDEGNEGAEPVEDHRSVPLLSGDDSESFRGRWSDIQVGFVDEPREMVERADALVAELMQRLASQFSEERGRLETQWDKDDDVSTEDLRLALQRYRSFFQRLLTA
jgi:hypothetical protein